MPVLAAQPALADHLEIFLTAWAEQMASATPCQDDSPTRPCCSAMETKEKQRMMSMS